MTKYPRMKRRPRTKPKSKAKPKSKRREKAMPMKEAIDKEDWERQDKGLKPEPKPKVEMPVYDAPVIKDHLKLDDVPFEDLVSFAEERKIIFNKEGVRFIGFDVIIRLKDKPAMSGWMSEKDVLQLQKLIPRR